MSHSWKFFRIGGFDQVRLDSATDITSIDQLNQKLWAALACPTRGLEFDSATLDIIDTDKDGRIRAPELIAATRWLGTVLKDAGGIVKGGSSVALSAINDSTPDGKAVLAAAKQILLDLGKKDAPSISLDDTLNTAKIFANTKFNGDGVIPAEAAEDDATKKVVEDVIACYGSLPDRSGKPGISQEKADLLYTDCAAFADWHKKAEADSAIMIVGAKTADAAAAVRAVRTKVDDFFARCRLASYDTRAIAALNRNEQEYLNIAAKDLSIDACEISGFPLARIEAGRALPLEGSVNPAWAGAIAVLRDHAVKPILGERRELTEADWSALKAKLAPYEAWTASKAGAAVEKLGIARVREILAGKGKDSIAALIAKDLERKPAADAISAVEKLVRFQRDLYKLLLNFVNFKDFYDGGDKAIWQSGVLYLDGRSCELCIRVEDSGKHGTFAVLSKCYLAYCDLVRKSTGEKMQIAAAFTDGDSDNLMVGRNGIFYDRRGNDWDATITKIVDNPISIRQAFWSPYKKLIRYIEEQIAKRAAAADDAANKRLQESADSMAKSAETGEAKKKEEKKIDIGVVAALGVAVGGITAALGALLQAFFGLGMWMPLGLLGLVILISGPSMVIAWLKLRQRNLGPLLDANGWAVNTQAKINIPFGKSLTGIATLPPGSQRDLTDPYADSNKGRKWFVTTLVLALLIAAAWYFGLFHQVPFLDNLPKSSFVENMQKAEQEDAAKKAQPK
ncbi:MAG: hypothetical protein JNJ88_14210 [Planctomycetes bacterium]|nr:hypothetical protein [Planctomycetota bacterium]